VGGGAGVVVAVLAGVDGAGLVTAAVVGGRVDGGAGVAWACADGAVVTVWLVGAAFVTVGLGLTTSAFTVGMPVAAADVGGEDDDELAAAAMPMTNTSPQHTSNPVSTLCLAAQGFRSRGPPGGP